MNLRERNDNEQEHGAGGDAKNQQQQNQQQHPDVQEEDGGREEDDNGNGNEDANNNNNNRVWLHREWPNPPTGRVDVRSYDHYARRVGFYGKRYPLKEKKNVVAVTARYFLEALAWR